MEKFHLIGIKGTGMCSLACILQDLGYEVQGSDHLKDYFTSSILKERQIKVFEFNSENITDDKKYIASLAYDISNPEIKKVLLKGYHLDYYNDFVNDYFRGIKIGVSGTHGKTTVATIIKTLLPKEKTTYLIGDGQGGGVVDNTYFVFEACEYKNHFHRYQYDYLIINNIELDHPDFFSSVDEVVKSFQKASEQAKYLIINGDDLNCKNIVHNKKVTFGLGEGNDIKGQIISRDNNGYKVKVSYFDKEKLFVIPHPGDFMVYNFLASIALCSMLSSDWGDIQEKIFDFKRPFRRMEEYYHYDNIIIDDYAHHPTEIKHCLNAIKQKYPDKQLVVIFQPHTYSRSLALMKEFIASFASVDQLYLEKTFTSVRERFDPILEKYIVKQFKNAYRFNSQNFKKIKNLRNSVILFLGAGDVNRYINQLIN